MKVIGYTRVSTDEQAKDGYSLPSQRKAITEYCQQRGWDLVKVIEDDGYTARNVNRPGIREVQELLTARNGPRGLVVVRMDRLVRSTRHLCDLVEHSIRRKWALVLMDFHIDTSTPNGRKIARDLASMGEWESEINGVRVSEGMREKYAQLRAAGITPTFGFQRKATAETVALIVRQRQRGQSYNAIAKALERKGTPPPSGKRWYPSTVERICKREARTRPNGAAA